jgi:hypothetical protein
MDSVQYCMRSECQQPATAQLTYDYAGQLVWLQPLTHQAEPGEWPLCTRHAETMKVPRGWELIDDREPVVPMFAAYAS